MPWYAWLLIVVVYGLLIVGVLRQLNYHRQNHTRVVEDIKKRYPKWIIVMNPDGTTERVQINNEEEMREFENSQ